MWVGRVARIDKTDASLFTCYEFSPLTAKRKWKYYSIQLSPISERTQILEGSQASPACPSDTSSVKMKMGMEHWWNDTDRGNWSTGRETLYSVGGRWMNGYGALVEWFWQGKTEVLGEKHYTELVVGEWMGMEHWWNDIIIIIIINCNWVFTRWQ
jgi:hypothetical protein